MRSWSSGQDSLVDQDLAMCALPADWWVIHSDRMISGARLAAGQNHERSQKVSTAELYCTRLRAAASSKLAPRFARSASGAVILERDSGLAQISKAHREVLGEVAFRIGGKPLE